MKSYLLSFLLLFFSGGLFTQQSFGNNIIVIKVEEEANGKKVNFTGLLNYQQRNGEKTNYGYDNLYRLKWVSIAGKHSQGFAYDKYDRIVQSNDTVDGSKVFINKTEYDLLGRVSKETYPSDYSITNQ